MLKIQMLEQIMNNENSDDDCDNPANESELTRNEQIEFYVPNRSSTRWVFLTDQLYDELF